MTALISSEYVDLSGMKRELMVQDFTLNREHNKLVITFHMWVWQLLKFASQQLAHFEYITNASTYYIESEYFFKELYQRSFVKSSPSFFS